MFGKRTASSSPSSPASPAPQAKEEPEVVQDPPKEEEAAPAPAAEAVASETNETPAETAPTPDTPAATTQDKPQEPAPEPAKAEAEKEATKVADKPAPTSGGKKDKFAELNASLEEKPAEEEDDKEKQAKEEAKKEQDANKEKVYNILMEQIDIATSSSMPRDELKRQIFELIGEIVIENRIMVSTTEQQVLATQIVDDMLGFGPLEELLRDDAITDIMVNGPYQIYVEKGGKLQLSDVKFRDNDHVMGVATRIVTGVGRRVDESSPICDARLPDGSRVNVVAMPLAIGGTSMSIRKFSEKKITLDTLCNQFGSMSPAMCKTLKILGAIRLNTLVSGGTGSGKTTMLNALSRMIDFGERTVTIEDAAELQLQQPHVVPLETRPPNLEGTGEITMRDLVKNALRMRPDRIILGEVRGGEAFDLLQAMNTGHDGSMGTLHANNPREALTRLQNMINMAGVNLPPTAIKTQIAGAANLVVQVQRMRDGGRRTTHITEVVGMEGDVIITQDLFHFEFTGEDENGKLTGAFKSSKVRPACLQKAAYFGLDQALLEAIMDEDYHV